MNNSWFNQTIASELELIRRKVCPNPSNDCNCEYIMTIGVQESFKTGCPELSDLISVYNARSYVK